MSESRGQAEPSMEEILASIRRIISQESQQASDGMQQSETTAPAPAEAASSAPAADVLLLTEMVAEDGSVVSLSDVRAAAAGRTAAPAPHAAEAASVAPAAEMAASPGVAFSAIAEPGGATTAAEPASPQAASHDQPVGSPAVTSETERKDTLVSQESRAAAAAAFAELSRHVTREREAAVGGGRTVEDLVREALDPMLKNWLDTHLPSMVERMVRQEIQRVVRQADDVA